MTKENEILPVHNGKFELAEDSHILHFGNKIKTPVLHGIDKQHQASIEICDIRSLTSSYQ
jgi:cytochrome c oxidase assembly protein Cox11